MHKYTILCSVAVLQHMLGDYPLTKEDILRSFYSPHIETLKVPPAKVRHPDYDGIGTFVEIDSKSANFVYEFPNCSYLVEV